MSALRIALVLALALFVQAGLGRFWAGASRYVDLLLVPVVCYGIAGTQRSAMLVGCAAGLLHDAWFQLGAFGLTGFKRTLVGWSLGGLGARLDLNHAAGRFVGGAAAALADGLLDALLGRLLDRSATFVGVADLAAKSAVTGALVVACFSVLERLPRRWRPAQRGMA